MALARLVICRLAGYGGGGGHLARPTYIFPEMCSRILSPERV